jgi:hypothetical protein
MRRWVSCFPIITGVLLVGYGCAQDEEPRLFDLDAGSDTPMTEVPPTDAGVRDAQVDADADVAGPKCTSDGWCTTSLPRLPPISGTRDIRDVWADAKNGAWAVANGDGEILRYEEGEWKIVYRLPTWKRMTLSAIAGDETGRIVAVGGRQTSVSGGPGGGPSGEVVILHSDDGSTFELESFDARVFGLGARPTTDSTLSSVQESMLYDIIATGPHEFLIGAIDGIYRGDGVSAWSPEYAPERGQFDYGYSAIYALWTTPGEVHGCGVGLGSGYRADDDMLTVRRSPVDGGVPSWSFQWAPHTGACLAGWAGAAPAVWRATTFDPLYGNFPVDPGIPSVRPSGGSAPALIAPNELLTGAPYRGMWGRSADDLWVVGSASTIFHFDGAAWSGGVAFAGTAPLVSTLNAIAGLPTGEMWIVGSNIALHREAQP